MRRSIAVLVLASAAFLAACGSSSPSSTSSSTTSPSTSDHVVSRHSVTGVDQLTAIACPTATVCEAVGSNALNGEGVVVTVTKGAPGAPHLVSGTKSLSAISCPSPTMCEAAGVGAGHGLIVPITSGSPGTPQAVLGVTTLQTISCSSASASSCQAGGRAASAGAVSLGTNVHWVSGTTSVNAIDCPGTSCTSVASTSNGKYNDVVVPVTAGVPGAFQVVPPGTSTFSAITCPAASSCVVVGRGLRTVKGRNTPEAVVLSVKNGKPGKLVGVPSSATLLLQDVACGSGTSDCVAVGTTGSASGSSASARGVFLPVSGGVPGSVGSVGGAPVALTGIACATPTTCEAVGDSSNGAAAVVITLSTP